MRPNLLETIATMVTLKLACSHYNTAVQKSQFSLLVVYYNYYIFRPSSWIFCFLFCIWHKLTFRSNQLGTEHRLIQFLIKWDPPLPPPPIPIKMVSSCLFLSCSPVGCFNKLFIGFSFTSLVSVSLSHFSDWYVSVTRTC